MKKFFKNIFYSLVVLIALNGCQSVKDGLTGKKKSNSDEFLVEKKNPLVLPPKFDELPIPMATIKKDENEEDDSLKKIITKNSSLANNIPKDTKLDSSLEKNILEKIKSN